MNNADQFHRFIFEEHEIRGELVFLDNSYQEVFKRSEYPDAIRSLLGNCLTASVLLSGTLKFDGILSIQARGKGPVTLLMAECTHKRQVRAIARYDDTGSAPITGNVQEILGDGQLAITIEPDKGKRYQGIIPLDKPDISQCLEEYFTQSEQLDTLILLFNDAAGAAGLMLQKLPGFSGQNDDDVWNRLCHLAKSISFDELKTLPADQILHRLFHEEEVRLFPPESVEFACSCTLERSANAIKSLGMEDAYQLLSEQGAITINCQFCNEQYELDQAALDNIFGNPAVH